MLRAIKLLIDYIRSVVKIACIFLCALLLPRFFVYYSQPLTANASSQEAFKLGLENITHSVMRSLITPQEGKLCSVALITNHSGKNQAGKRNIEALLDNGVALKTIFTPRHGFYANNEHVHTTIH